MKWLGNVKDPGIPTEQPIIMRSCASPDVDIAWLSLIADKKIGVPQATQFQTSEELKASGMVGLFEVGSSIDQPTSITNKSRHNN